MQKTSAGNAAVLATMVALAAGGFARADDAELQGESRKWLSVSACVDIESAYVCRGFVWDAHPISSQYADGTVDFGTFGRVSAYVWSLVSMTPQSHVGDVRYRFTEADYGLRYAFDMPLAEDWTLTSGVIKHWVTTPGRDHSDANSVIDWQAFQALSNPYVTPYWRIRYIYKPFCELYGVVGVKRTFPLFADGLSLTLDLFGDMGDSRHCMNIFGPKPGNPDSNYRGGLQSLNAVARIDYRLTEHLGVFAFAGYYGLVTKEARDSVDAMRHTDAVSDLAYGGVGLTVEF